MKINLVRARHFTHSELGILNGVLDLMLNAFNSTDFRIAIEEHDKFITPENFSNKTIYSIIMGGQELYNSDGLDHEADLDITMRRGGNDDEYGETIEGMIFTYRDSFLQLSGEELAGHYAHEYCHTLGFEDPWSSGDLPRNVPYEVGRMVTSIAQRISRVFLVSDMEEIGAEMRSFNSNKTFSIVESAKVKLTPRPNKKNTEKKPTAAASKKAVKRKSISKKTTSGQAARTKKNSTKPGKSSTANKNIGSAGKQKSRK